MQNQQQSDRLSWGDTVFLHLEREGMPLNVASICMFEGEISFKDCVQFIESKLPLIPRYLKRVVPAPFGLGLPSWEYDPQLPPPPPRARSDSSTRDRHRAEVSGRKALRYRDGPATPIVGHHAERGLRNKRTALIIRLHHCLADGIAGVGIINVLLDANPEAPRLPKRKIRFNVPPPRDPLASLTTGLVDSYSDFVKRILSALTDLLSMAERAAANGGKLPTSEFASLFPEITAFTERLRFNVVYQGPQKFACTG